MQLESVMHVYHPNSGTDQTAAFFNILMNITLDLTLMNFKLFASFWLLPIINVALLR